MGNHFKNLCSKFIFSPILVNYTDNYSLFFVDLVIFFPCICNFVIKLCNVGLLPHVCLAVKSGVTCNIHMIHIHSSNVMIQILKKEKSNNFPFDFYFVKNYVKNHNFFVPRINKDTSYCIYIGAV